MSYLPCCPPRSLSTPFINLWRCPYALIPISLSSSCPMSANTSRVIWKGKRPQKSVAKPGPIPKIEDPSVQKMECIHGATKRVHTYFMFYCTSNCCHLLARSLSLLQDHTQLLQPEAVQNFILFQQLTRAGSHRKFSKTFLLM